MRNFFSHSVLPMILSSFLKINFIILRLSKEKDISELMVMTNFDTSAEGVKVKNSG